MLPVPPPPPSPSPRKQWLNIRWVAPVLATVILVAGFVGVLQAARGGTPSTQVASGPAPYAPHARA